MKYELPEEISVDADGPVRTVLINRPEDLNCVNENLHWALANVWRQLAADKEAKVVVLSGARRLAERLAAQPTEALQDTKRIVNMYLSQALGGPMQAGFAAEVATMQSDDHRQRLLEFKNRANRK